LAVYLYIHKQTTPKHTSKGSPSFKVGGTNQGWPAKRVFWAQGVVGVCGGGGGGDRTDLLCFMLRN